MFKKYKYLLLLLSSIFIGVGLFMLWLIANSTIEWYAMQSWYKVPAEILEVKWENHSKNSKKSSSFQIKARYRYTFRGITYESQRVSMDTINDISASKVYYEEMYSELSRYLQSGQFFQCYVNPKNPSESIVYQDFSWKVVANLAMFALLFGTFGSLALTFVWSMGKDSQTKPPISQSVNKFDKTADETEQRISDDRKIGLIVLAIITLLVNVLMTLPAAINFEKFRVTEAWILIFPALGLLLMAYLILNFLRWYKYGDSVLLLSTNQMQKEFRGKIQVLNFDAPANFTLRLRLRHTVTTGTGKKRHSNSRIVYDSGGQVSPESCSLNGRYLEIPVSFVMPFDSREKIISLKENEPNTVEISWYLSVISTKKSWLAFATDFTLPIYQSSTGVSV